MESAFNLGVLLGVCFSGLGLTWLLLANRTPYLDQFASERNLALAIAFGLLSLVPICRFMKSPGRSFLSSITAWTILTAPYFVRELRFTGHGTRLSAFHLFVLGGVVFGLALAWVASLVIALRQDGAAAVKTESNAEKRSICSTADRLRHISRLCDF